MQQYENLLSFLGIIMQKKFLGIVCYDYIH